MDQTPYKEKTCSGQRLFYYCVVMEPNEYEQKLWMTPTPTTSWKRSETQVEHKTFGATGAGLSQKWQCGRKNNIGLCIYLIAVQ